VFYGKAETLEQHEQLSIIIIINKLKKKKTFILLSTKKETVFLLLYLSDMFLCKWPLLWLTDLQVQL